MGVDLRPRLPFTLALEREGMVSGDLMLEVQDGWGQAEVTALRSVRGHGVSGAREQ